MAHRLEVALNQRLYDAEGETVRKKACTYFGLDVTEIRTVHVLTIDADLTPEQLELIRTEIFTNPVTQISSYQPLAGEFDWALWVGYRPGVRDNAGATAAEAVEDLLKRPFKPGEAIYTSRLYLLKALALPRSQAEKIAKELLANDIIQRWKVISKKEWDSEKGIGLQIPKVLLEHLPDVQEIPIRSHEELLRISQERHLFLNPHDIPTIRSYFMDARVLEARRKVGLSAPTDVELEYISQARSDHCNHNTFKGLFRYTDSFAGERRLVDNLFKTCIEEPTLHLKQLKPWVVSVLWDNAGVARFDDRHYYVITGETHNSPSNMEAYGGALTGIVGVYRDPMGTGKGAKLVAGTYGYCVGHLDYHGPLKPHLHPRRLLDGVVEGVKDGGNKSGIPTIFGQVFFHNGYLGKCLVFVTAIGIMPEQVDNTLSHQKTTSPGDLIIMCGGRVGKDGIHGVTAASESYSEHTPSGHVQIGDPYTQKKMHDFLLEARDEGLIVFITDNGGGGLSSSVGESAGFSNGAEVNLDKVPLKYEGLDMWEIWVSESQERMTVAIRPAHLDRFSQLARKHAVEISVIGRYTDTGKLHIIYGEKTCAYVDLSLLSRDFPQWEFEAEWIPPQKRGLVEPVMGEVRDPAGVLKALLARPNMASKEWIIRQYDHEVQGGSVIKPLVGKNRDVNSDAAVIRPVLDSGVGLAVSQAVNPTYSKIDAYHMAACTIDEAVRRVIAVGADPQQIGGVDNFCWPTIQFDPVSNPDGPFKAAQLVRANWALKEMCLAYGVPLLSGKDSMYIDGNLPGNFGERHKVSGLETLQFTASASVPDVSRCMTLDFKTPGDLIYVLGITRNELGGSEFYDMFGYAGLNVPQVHPAQFFPAYQKLHLALQQGLLSSAHGVYRGGLIPHLAFCAMAGEVAIQVDLRLVAREGGLQTDQLAFSETPGRFILSVAPPFREQFEDLFTDLPLARLGRVTDGNAFHAVGLDGRIWLEADIRELKSCWKSTFGDLI
jgi:phosphoribosylformylglycinamidine synthase